MYYLSSLVALQVVVMITHLRGQNDDRHFADDIFIYTFVNEKFCILIEISPKVVAKGSIDNIPVLV